MFHEAIGPVRKLDEVAPRPSADPPEPHPHSLERDEADALIESRDDPFSTHSPSADKALDQAKEVLPEHALRQLQRRRRKK